MKLKTFMICMSVCAMALLSAGCEAQEIRVRLDAKGTVAPALIQPFHTLKNTFVGDLRMFAFGGLRLQGNQFVGGGGIERKFRIADNASGIIGMGIEFSPGRKPRGAWFVGMELRV